MDNIQNMLKQVLITVIIVKVISLNCEVHVRMGIGSGDNYLAGEKWLVSVFLPLRSFNFHFDELRNYYINHPDLECVAFSSSSMNVSLKQ